MLECLSLATLPSLVLSLSVRPGAYPQVEHLQGPSLGQATALLANIRQHWKGLLGTNTLSHYIGLGRDYKLNKGVGDRLSDPKCTVSVKLGILGQSTFKCSATRQADVMS